MSQNQELKIGIFHDAITGQTITRELTTEELAAFPEPVERQEEE